MGEEAEGYRGGGGYYEEQELGLHPIAGSSGHGHDNSGGGYGAQSGVLPEYGAEEMRRGRSRSREPTAYIGGGRAGLDERSKEVMLGGQAADPFGDGAERSELGAERSELRGVSPRPVGQAGEGHRGVGSTGSGGSGGEERKSMFHENM